jgi:ribulose-5-phosphate 4-epimerase/fuculose-1-phosphate aldolase
VIDTEGRIVEGEGEPNSEFWIHARVYAARADVGGVVHAHPDACVCLTQIVQPHRVVHNQGGIFADGVPEYSAIGLIRSRALGDALALVLARGNALMMRAHGITTAFEDVRSATVAACYLEESATLQLRMLAAAGGDASRLRALTREEALPLRDQIGHSVARRAGSISPPWRATCHSERVPVSRCWAASAHSPPRAAARGDRPGPSLERLRETGNLAVAQQPRDFRDRGLGVGEVALARSSRFARAMPRR